MGSLYTRVVRYFTEFKGKTVIFGLDNTGKTTIIYQMKLGQVVSSVPMIGFNVEEVKHKEMTLMVWDIGGSVRYRNLERHYYVQSTAIVFVADLQDQERMELARAEFDDRMQEKQLEGLSVLVFANKKDQARITGKQLIQCLRLEKLNRRWHLQPCCALTGQGIAEGFQWLRKEHKRPRR